MKILLNISLSILLISCGQDGNFEFEAKTEDSLKKEITENCSIKRDEELGQSVISCPDGTEVAILDAIDGQDGLNGKDGSSCLINENSQGAMITCGETSAYIKNGEDGEDGSACSVTTASDDSGAIIECSDGTISYINHGEDGTDGLDFVEEIIDPCGTETTHGLDEVILKLSSGDFLAHYAHGNKQYLTTLNKNQNYTTTDGTGCKFNISDDGEIILY